MMGEATGLATPMTAPRIELICPGCRHVHEHPAEHRGGTTTCPECDREFHAPDTVSVIYLPWEDRGRIGWRRALYETVRTSLLAPRTFFRQMPIAGGWLSPASYVAVMGGVSLVCVALREYLFLLLRGEQPVGVRVFFTVLALTAGMGATTLLLFVGVLHLMVLLMGGSAAKMETTARVVAYASTALLLAVIPQVGLYLSGLWLTVLTVIGLREAQELSTTRAIVAVLTPGFLFYMLVSGGCQPPPGAAQAPPPP